MLLISLETAVPLSPSKSPSVAVELAADRTSLPRAFHDPGDHLIKPPAMRRAAAICPDTNSLLSNGKLDDGWSGIEWHRVAIGSHNGGFPTHYAGERLRWSPPIPLIPHRCHQRCH